MAFPSRYPAKMYRRINGQDWILTVCVVCGADNYCEQHGKTAECHKCKRETEHESVPMARRTGFYQMSVTRRG